MDTGAICVNVCVPGFFLLMGCYVIWYTINGYRERQRWPGAYGIVQGYHVDVNSDGDGTSYAAAVTFTYELDGQTVEGRGALGTGGWSGPKLFATRAIAKAERQSPPGSPIEIIIDPKKPRRALPASARGLQVGTILFAMVFALVGAVWMAITAPGPVQAVINSIMTPAPR